MMVCCFDFSILGIVGFRCLLVGEGWGFVGIVGFFGAIGRKGRFDVSECFLCFDCL